MRCLFCILCFLSVTAVTAQQQKRWYVLPQLGLLNGVDLVSAQVMLSGGLVHEGWDLGLGTGADYYSIRTIPVVVDVRKRIGKMPLVAYTNMGYNIAAPLNSQYMYGTEGWNHSKSSFSNGWYGEWGLGYSFELKKQHQLLLSLGYSLKTAGEHYSETIPRDFPPYYSEINEHHFDYHFSRIIFKLGVRL